MNRDDKNIINSFGDKRYYSLNNFLREKFGEKVFKISLDAGFSCPNRDGTISKGGWIFAVRGDLVILLGIEIFL